MSGNRKLERDVKDSGSVCILSCFISILHILNSHALGGGVLLLNLFIFGIGVWFSNKEFRVEIHNKQQRDRLTMRSITLLKLS